MVKLSEQEKNSVELFLKGCQVPEIAKQLFVTRQTAQGYLNKAKLKLNCASNHALKSVYERYKDENFKL